MANTLTSLIPDAFAALDVVSRELVGFIPAVARDSRADRVPVGQTLRSTVAPSNTSAADITAAMSLPSAGDQTISNKSLTITKARYTKFSWNGEEIAAVNTGPGFLTIQQDQIAQAIRALINEIEVDIANAFAVGASRAYGTAATTPFPTAADFSDAAQLFKILDDNGAPSSDRHMVLNTTATANLRGKQSGLFRVNEAGTDSLLRRGSLGNLMGFEIHESAQVNNQTAGTNSGATTNAAGYAVGSTTFTLASAGTGTILAGDVITFAGDTNKYVVVTGDADVSNGGTITIAEPGIRIAMSAATKAITTIATSARNVGFSRNAALLATRLPNIPPEGDLATDRQTITDPRTGLSLELAVYPGFRMNVYFVGVAWGVTVFKPEHSAILLG